MLRIFLIGHKKTSHTAGTLGEIGAKLIECKKNINIVLKMKQNVLQKHYNVF